MSAAATSVTPTSSAAPYAPIALTGPTASGKSRLAMRLAQSLPLEIISVDSVLIYQTMDIGTAKPSPEEMALVPHHLINILSPNQSYSAAQFVRDTHACIAQIQARERLPLLVGGTMLYFLALRQGLNDLPSADAQVRQQVQQESLRHGWPAMHARLMHIDPITAQRLSPQDSQRIGRALEVYLQTGKTLSSFFEQNKNSLGSLPDLPLISLEPTQRQWLHTCIADRVDDMLAKGLVQEVKALMQTHGGLSASLPSMRSVGYRQVIDSLQGRKPWDDLAQRITIATRQLAKRQITWLRSMQRTVLACDAEEKTNTEATLALVHRFLQNRG